MTKLFNEQGNLNDTGKERTEKLLFEIDNVLSTASSENEVRILASILANIVGSRSNEWALHLKKNAK